jgi:hypothetical protein
VAIASFSKFGVKSESSVAQLRSATRPTNLKLFEAMIFLNVAVD